MLHELFTFSDVTGDKQFKYSYDKQVQLEFRPLASTVLEMLKRQALGTEHIYDFEVRLVIAANERENQ